MKKSLFVTILLSLILLTACGKPTLERAEKYLDKEDYEKAIEIYDKLIEEDESNYEAWLGKMDAYMEDDEYGDAADVAKDLYEVILEAYEADPEDEAVEDAIKDFKKAAEDIAEEEDDFATWYNDLSYSSIDVSEYAYKTIKVGETIELGEIPEGVMVYYNFDNKEVSTEDTLYKDAISFPEAGEYEIRLNTFTLFGEGYENYMYITVVAPPPKPELSVEAGTYSAPLVINFIEPSEDHEIYYTIDGTDPLTSDTATYYWGDITLNAGEYTLRAVQTDYYMEVASEEVTAAYVVEPQAAPTATIAPGSYPGPINIQFSGFNEDSQYLLLRFDGVDPSYDSYNWDTYYYDPNFDLSLSKSYSYDPDYGCLLGAGTYDVRAVVYDYYNDTYSAVYSGTYTVEANATVPTPTFPAGTYEGPISVGFIGFDEEGYENIIYTTDGSDPTTSSNVYTIYGSYSTIYMDKTTTIKAVKYNYWDSTFIGDVFTYEYVIN